MTQINRPRVLVVALDGADKDLILRWANAGILPTFRSLMRTARWCTVANPPGLYAGSVWPSFYTGVSPARHGKYCSYQLKSGSYAFERVQGPDAGFETIWDALSKHAKKVAVIDAPKSQASTRIDGIHVVDWATEDFSIDLQSTPAALAAEIRARYGTNPIVESEYARATLDRLVDLRELLLSRLATKMKLSEDILAQERWDFFFTLFTEVHTAGHLCWHLHDENHPLFDERISEKVGDIVRDIYEATDAVVAKFLARAGPDTHVFVYSVNGMGPNYTGNYILEQALLALDKNRLSGLRRLLAGAADWVDAKTPGSMYDSIYPLQRKVRSSFGLPVRDRPFRSCFRVPSNEVCGGVRVNLVGREPNGIVEPDRYDEFCNTLSAHLSALANVETGNPVVKQVIKTRSVYSGERLDELPDLLVEWSQEARINGVYSPATGIVRKTFDAQRTGDHRPDGILFATGGHAPPGCAESQVRVSVMDLAPTLSSLLGTPFRSADGTDVSRSLGLELPA